MVSEAELVAELQAIGHEGWWGDGFRPGLVEVGGAKTGRSQVSMLSDRGRAGLSDRKCESQRPGSWNKRSWEAFEVTPHHRSWSPS